MLQRLIARSRQAQPTNWPANLTNSQTGKPYNLRPVLSSFHASPARWRLLRGGLGSGKTSAGAYEALKRIRSGNSGIIVAPDFAHFSKSTWPEFRRWIPWECVVERERYRASSAWEPSASFELHFLSETNQVATVYCGGIDVPAAWRGPNVNWFWFDEAARKKDDGAYKVLIGRARLDPLPAGWITTTPKMGWLNDTFVLKANRFKAEFHVRTIDNQENLDPDYIESLQTEYSLIESRQELGGEWVTAEGLVYSDFNEHNLTNDDPPEGAEIEIAYDDGFVDPRVILLIYKTPTRILIFDELYHRRHLGETCIKETLALVESKKLKRPELAYGSHEAIELREQWRLNNVRARGKVVPIVEAIHVVRRLICDSRGNRSLLVNRRCTNLIWEITRGYMYPEGTTRRDVETPIDENNHASDAMRYYAWYRGNS